MSEANREKGWDDGWGLLRWLRRGACCIKVGACVGFVASPLAWPHLLECSELRVLTSGCTSFRGHVDTVDDLTLELVKGNGVAIGVCLHEVVEGGNSRGWTGHCRECASCERGEGEE